MESDVLIHALVELFALVQASRAFVARYKARTIGTYRAVKHLRAVPLDIVLVGLLLACPSFACMQMDGQGSTPASAAAFPELTGPVNDFAQVIDQSNSRQLESLSRLVQRETGYVLVVVTLQTCAPLLDVRDCSMRVFENRGNGIGQRGKDNGILVLLALAERQVRITTGYGVEHIVPDQFAAEVTEMMRAPFSQGRYGDGLRQGVERVAARIREFESQR